MHKLYRNSDVKSIYIFYLSAEEQKMKNEIMELKKILEKANNMLSEIVKEGAQHLKRGDIIEIGGYDWIVLKVEGGKLHCLLKGILKDRIFDPSNNDYRTSSIRAYLNNEFLMNLVKNIGEGYLNPISTDQLSLDGQKEYGVLESEDQVGLLTVDMYRENRDILLNIDEWWWTATPWSTPCNDYKTAVCCISSDGIIDFGDCFCNHAARPFCIFNTTIFVHNQ